MLEYCFETRELFGRPNHFIMVGAPYEMLCTISTSYLCRLEEVTETITKLEEVISGKVDGFAWGDDACSFSSEADLTYIDYDFDQHMVTIPTTEILQLLRDWLAYLQQQTLAA